MLPEKLKPYEDHGLEISYREGAKEGLSDCPFCSREGKFSINVETGQWRCFVCATGSGKGGGNLHSFLKLIYDESPSPGPDMMELAARRKLLRVQTLDAWGVRQSSLTGQWLLPAHNAEGKLNNVYRYVKSAENKWRLWSTSGCSHGLFGRQFFDPKKPDVYITEGPWDGMALVELMRMAKRTQEGDLTETGSESLSLYGRANVVAVPGCNVFNEKWADLFANKRVFILFDNDHPRIHPKTGKEIEPAGLAGMRRVAAILAQAETPPREIHYLQWGEDGYNTELPSGYDLRDHLCRGNSGAERLPSLANLLTRLKPVPTEWIPGRAKEAEPGGTDMECLPCAEWKTLQAAWKKALKWTDGLDRALACMLASITSVRMPGDQLWIKVVGPPSCLDGDTPIYDPVDGTVLSVRERYERGQKFFVYSRSEDGSVGVAQALPPVRHPPAPMYKVTFASGRQIVVTGGHRVWNGSEYVEIRTIADALPLSGVYHLPTIEGVDLSAHGQGVHHLMQIVQDSQSGYRAYPCSCDGSPHLAEDTGLDVSP